VTTKIFIISCKCLKEKIRLRMSKLTRYQTSQILKKKMKYYVMKE